MRHRTIVLIVALGVALALPGRAHAVDHVVLIVPPTRIAALPATRGAWMLSGRVVGPTSTGATETFGVSLTRSFMAGRAEELHGFRAAPAHTVTFDGERGRWDAHFGTLLRVTMSITATGAQEPIGAAQGCRGALMRVPVELRGTFVLRTGTTFFKTIRRARLAGTVTFNPGGSIDCTAPAASSCTMDDILHANRRITVTSDAMLLMSPSSGGWTSLVFADRAGASQAGTWYHVMRVTGFNPLTHSPPAITVRLPSTLPIRGSGSFVPEQASTTQFGPCRTSTSSGTFNGTFRTQFAGWGARLLVLAPADNAGYSEYR
jgi:hypothetical protein